MKKLLLILLMLVSLQASAQKEVTKFLGIPVDGTKNEMIRKLKLKGFELKQIGRTVFLEGEFNGSDVHIFIKTNNNKVCRIMVCDANYMNASAIKVRFNTLCHQFENNEKYTRSLSEYVWPLYMEDSVEYIGPDEDVEYEIKIKDKRYQAGFFQKMENSIFDNESLVREHVAKFVEKWNSRYEKEENKLNYDDALIQVQDYLNGKTNEEDVKLLVKYILNDLFYQYASKKSVWFMISSYENEYFITLFYDNEYNRAHGEDL